MGSYADVLKGYESVMKQTADEEELKELDPAMHYPHTVDREARRFAAWYVLFRCTKHTLPPASPVASKCLLELTNLPSDCCN